MRPVRRTVAAGVLAVVACSPACARRPQRVATDDGRCAVTMPGTAGRDVFPVTLADGTAVQLQSRNVGNVGAPETVPPRGGHVYVLRQATVPAASPRQGRPLLEAAGQSIVKALADHRYDSPRITSAAGSDGAPLEVRAGGTPSTAVVRLYAIAGGYCEVGIFGADSEEAIAAYFATAQIRP